MSFAGRIAKHIMDRRIRPTIARGFAGCADTLWTYRESPDVAQPGTIAALAGPMQNALGFPPGRRSEPTGRPRANPASVSLTLSRGYAWRFANFRPQSGPDSLTATSMNFARARRRVKRLAASG